MSSKWTFIELHKLLSMYPKDSSSIFLQCKFYRPQFIVNGWDIEDCEFRLCRGSNLTEDIILFVCLEHDDLRIRVVELYYAKEDTCGIVHIHLDTKKIVNFYRDVGPTLSEIENAGIKVDKFLKERFKY